MIKKLFSFICCLAPFGAGAVDYIDPTMGSGGQIPSQESVSVTTDATVVRGNEYGTPSTLNVGAGGVTVTNDLIVGDDGAGAAAGTLYIANSVTPAFTIASNGTVSVGGTLKNENATRAITLGGVGVGDSTPEVRVDVDLGGISNAGTVNLSHVNNLTVGGVIDNSGTLNAVAAGTVTLGDITGGANATTMIEGAAITTGTVQNGLAGTMDLHSSGGIDVGTVGSGASLLNSGNMNVVAAGDVAIDGVLKNDSPDGTLNVTAANFSVRGNSTDDGIVSSLVNNGNLIMNVSGTTNLAHGFNFAAMPTDRRVDITTGALEIGSVDGWQRFLTNNLNDFRLSVTGAAGLNTAANIVNGNVNGNAKMVVSATNLTANSVTNSANLEITTPANGGNLTFNGAITGNDAATTVITAANKLDVDGAVTNYGNMTLSGEGGVTLATVSNSGVMNIASQTSVDGIIDITSDVTNNAGTMNIDTRQLKIAGIVNNVSGTMEIKASDYNGGAVKIGGINVAGGALNMNALNGAIDVDGNVDVTGGALNFGASTTKVDAGGPINVAGTIALGGAGTADGVNIAADAGRFVLNSGESVKIGAIEATANDVVRALGIGGTDITVDNGITVANKGQVALMGAQTITVNGAVSVNDGGTFDFYANDVNVGTLGGNGKIIGRVGELTRTGVVTATDGDINVAGIWFDGTNPNVGMVIDTGATATAADYTLTTTKVGTDIFVDGGVSVGALNSLNLVAADSVTVVGAINNGGKIDIDTGATGVADFRNTITNGGNLFVDAKNVTALDINNTGVAAFRANGGAVTVENVVNSGNLTLGAAGDNVTAGEVNSTGGVVEIDAQSLHAANVGITGGAANISAANVIADGDIKTSGDLVHGSTNGMLNFTSGATRVAAQNLDVGGDFYANSGNANYVIANDFGVTGALSVATGATLNATAKTFDISTIVNNGVATLRATDSMKLNSLVSNGGALTLDSGATVLNLGQIQVNAGNVTFIGTGLSSDAAFKLPGGLYQNYAGVLGDGDVNIAAAEYNLVASSVDVARIDQAADTTITIRSSDVSVAGDISARDLHIAANPVNDWMNVTVGGSILGNTRFVGLEHMSVGGNYVFDNNSSILAAILPYVAGGGINATPYNYWATVSLNNDKTLGQITNGPNAAPLISVGGMFKYDATLSGDNRAALGGNQIGINLFDIVDQGTAIWLVHADNGLQELGDKIRNLNVNFCNADGSICFNYLDSLNANNGSDGELPAFISVRDTNNDGISDSLYVVFDPRFGGPVEVFKIQPIVAVEPGADSNEVKSAGAIDNLVAGQLQNSGFVNRTPIEAIPVIFKNTNMAEMAQQLYNRMEAYNLNRDGYALTQFSRLFQPREGEQFIGSMVMNEHVWARDFEDRMMDEFIWNRNRNLKKAWLDADFGMFNQKVSSDNKASGNRFSVSGGFDWQESKTLILGVAARVSHMSADHTDTVDLGYKGMQIVGGSKVDVADTDIGFGGYLTKTLNEKFRAYGNAFLDIHFLNVDRDQTYMSSISGDATAVSLVSEWGLMHDWLNQYIVGNLYARAGYNFGFSLTEKAAGADYMKIESDGYLMLTPGYTVTAQKRIYPSVWFQVRPYASVGVEYDVLGTPDEINYKFAAAHGFTSYDVDIDPLWANIGGGLEFLSVSGVQVGLDYRYQYNADMQIHKIKLSGSYRF